MATEQQLPVYLSGTDLTARFHRGRRTIDRWVKDAEYKFPSPVMSGRGRTCLWRREDIEAWERDTMPTVCGGQAEH